ncbi:FAR1-related sequence 5-like protein [Tanacetum coccineum]
MDEEEVNKQNDLNKEVTVKILCDTVVEDVADRDTVIEEVTECMRTPRPTLYEQNEAPGESIYWEPRVEGILIPVEGTYYDTIDEALDMYTKYAEMTCFEVKKGGQRLTKSGAVQHKYLMCNKKGVPKGLFWESQEIPFKSLMIPLESYEIPLESHVIPVKSHKIPEESHVILLESHVILLFSQFESHEISMESQVIHIEIRISLESQMIHVESQVIRIESHVISLESHICKEIYNETDFKERFDKIVWNMFIEPLEFEEKWAQLIEDFGLQSHKWLKKMFNLREIWIPAYFIDSPLYGLMRTTSRSESENSFFKSFTSPGATLVSFMMSYESAMERQRYRQESLDFKTIEATPKCIT